MMYRPYIPQRVVEGTCVLDGPKFNSKICRRCGYRRNRSKVMPRYAMCESDVDIPISAENVDAMGIKHVIPMANKRGKV